MKRWFLTPALGLVALTVALPAHAQSSGWLGDRRYSGEARQSSYYDSRRVAYDTGYREGIKEGEKDGRHGDVFEFQDEKGYQRADKGFHREYGNVERYRQSFRTGYAAGYSDGYQRFAPRGGYGNRRDSGYGTGRVDPRRDPSWSRGPYGPAPGTGPGYGYPGQTSSYGPALQNGVNDGYEKGIEDARKRRSFDPLRHEWYRSADRHYDGRFGSRDQYKDAYREGFRSGYERGYREGGYR